MLHTTRAVDPCDTGNQSIRHGQSTHPVGTQRAVSAGSPNRTRRKPSGSNGMPSAAADTARRVPTIRAINLYDTGNHPIRQGQSSHPVGTQRAVSAGGQIARGKNHPGQMGCHRRQRTRGAVSLQYGQSRGCSMRHGQSIYTTRTIDPSGRDTACCVRRRQNRTRRKPSGSNGIPPSAADTARRVPTARAVGGVAGPRVGEKKNPLHRPIQGIPFFNGVAPTGELHAQAYLSSSC